MAPPPVVTGLSPKEGPPGTRITIRGEHFGSESSDLIGLTICGFDCLLSAEWKSPTKILAISGPGEGVGDVLVTTRFGGVGTCNVVFKGKHETIGPTKESAVWVEDPPLFLWGRHTLSTNCYQQEDPLGLSEEGNEKKFGENLSELFPNCTGDIVSENFSPSWFLLENHHLTSFNDLRAGLSHLSRKVEGQKEGHLSFLKANVASVIDQIDTILILKEKFEKDVEIYSTEPTLKLEKSIKESEHEARKLFDDVLTRRDRAEKTRNALNVLARFKTLFCLPCVIDRNIKKGEYDIVINDYMRVKNHFMKTDIPVFKVALNEIEKCVTGLQNTLHNRLTTMPITVDEQKRLIRHLINLECNYDPAWDAIKTHFDYLSTRIKQCYEEHKSTESALAAELNKMKNSNSASKFSKYTVMQDMTPESVLFIEEVCEIFSELFSNLWKLGQAYFGKELTHTKIEYGRQAEFKHIILTIIGNFSKNIRGAIIPQTLEKGTERNLYGNWNIPELDIIAPFLPDCLRYVRSTYAILIKLDLPSEPLDVISHLILDLRIYSMSILFEQTIEQIKQLGKQENWKLEFKGTQHGITDLPIKFEQSVQKVIEIVKESVFTSEQREGFLLANPQAQKELIKQTDAIFLTFHNVLKKLASQDDCDLEENHTMVVSQLIGTPNTTYMPHNNSNVSTWEQRLLTTLSNCQYTGSVVISDILLVFKKFEFQIKETHIENIKSRFKALEKSILDDYLEQKCDPLVGTIEPSMYLGKFDWDTSESPNDIKPYAKECINNLIHVHAEVNSISPMLINCVIPQVVQTVAEELYRLMSCVQKFSVSGRQQARADISVIQEFFSKYSSAKADNFFEEALKIIPPLEATEYQVVQDILKKCRTRMRLQMICLNENQAVKFEKYL